MRYTEFRPTQAQQTYPVQPGQVKQNRLRNSIAAGIAKNRARPIPTANDLAIGFARYWQVQKQANREYEWAQRAAAQSLESKVVPETPRPMQALQQVQENADDLHAYIALVRVRVARVANHDYSFVPPSNQ